LEVTLADSFQLDDGGDLFNLMMEAIHSPKCRFLQQSHGVGVTSQKTTFFIATPVKTSNLT
jgi:hypothetical protein